MTAKPKAKTGVLWATREEGLWCRLSAKKMSLAERQNDHERNSVCVPYRKYRKQMGLPVLRCAGNSVRLTWKLEPASKKAAKKGRE